MLVKSVRLAVHNVRPRSLTSSCPGPRLVLRKPPATALGPLLTSLSCWRLLSSPTCLVNWLSGLPAVEHSAPPMKDIVKILGKEVRL